MLSIFSRLTLSLSLLYRSRVLPPLGGFQFYLFISLLQGKYSSVEPNPISLTTNANRFTPFGAVGHQRFREYIVKSPLASSTAISSFNFCTSLSQIRSNVRTRSTNAPRVTFQTVCGTTGGHLLAAYTLKCHSNGGAGPRKCRRLDGRRRA